MFFTAKREELDDDYDRFHLDYKTLPKNSKKYWRQRYNLFRRFDEGIYMNAELWYSVTPESVAVFVSKFIQACDPSLTTICDVFCGGGGNSIQFARRFERVLAIDMNEENLYCTEKNCEIYGVRDKVELHLADWTQMLHDRFLMKTLQDEVDLVFASPPWGGPGYKNGDLFDLDLLIPLPIRELLESFFMISRNVCLFLPRNSDVAQISQVTRDLLGEEAHCRIIYVYDNGFIKGMLAFWGEKFMPEGHDFSIPPVLISQDWSSGGGQQQKEKEEVPSEVFTEDFYDERPNVPKTPAAQDYIYDESHQYSDVYQAKHDNTENSHGKFIGGYFNENNEWTEGGFYNENGEYVEGIYDQYGGYYDESGHYVEGGYYNEDGEYIYYGEDYEGDGDENENEDDDDDGDSDEDDTPELDFIDAEDYPDLDINDSVSVKRFLEANEDTQPQRAKRVCYNK